MLADTPFVLLEDRLTAEAGALLYTQARQVIACRDTDEIQEALNAVEAATRQGLHAAGYLAFEAAPAFEPRLRRRSRAPSAEPLLWFAAFERCDPVPAAEIDLFFGGLPPTEPVRDLRPGAERPGHIARVERALELIGAGDLYQVNLTFPIRFQYDGDPRALYGMMRARQPVAHGGLIWTGDTWILSVSPELFLEVRGDRVVTRPMKGTTPRGRDALEDAAQLATLQADPKQRAENLMIVDLLRNDLSRVCRPGTVQAPALFQAETYPTLHTLTSTVEGSLRHDVGLGELLAATFPCGSVVGAPKVRAAEVISDLEDAARGVYTGAIGAITPGGNMRLNVAIRTATLRDGAGVYGVGGGIVADSDPGAEYDEALLKGRVLSDLAADFQLIETLRWTRSGFMRLDLHLARLIRSADALRFSCDAEAIRAKLLAATGDWRDGQDRRVRLALSRDGSADLTWAPAPPIQDDAPARVIVAPERLDGADPLLRHKTSLRETHERAFAWAQSNGADEAILLNRHGAVADGSRSTIFARKNGMLVTPPLEAGALAGVLRQALLSDGQAHEEPISASDLEDFEVFIGSSLRGLRRAQMIPSPSIGSRLAAH